MAVDVSAARDYENGTAGVVSEGARRAHVVGTRGLLLSPRTAKSDSKQMPHGVAASSSPSSASGAARLVALFGTAAEIDETEGAEEELMVAPHASLKFYCRVLEF